MRRRMLSAITALVLCLGLLPATALAESPRAGGAQPAVTESGGTLTVDLNGGTLKWQNPGGPNNLYETAATDIRIRGTGTIEGCIDIQESQLSGSFYTSRDPVTVTFENGADVEITGDGAPPRAVNLTMEGDMLVVAEGAAVRTGGSISLGSSGSTGGSIEIGGTLELSEMSVDKIAIRAGGTLRSSGVFFLHVSGDTDLTIQDGGSYEIQIAGGGAEQFAIALSAAGLVTGADRQKFESTVAKFVNLGRNGYHFGDHDYVMNDGSRASVYTLLRDSDNTPVSSLTLEGIPQIIPVTGVNLDRNVLPLQTGTTGQLTAAVTPSNTTLSKAVRWTSSDAGIATVDQTGKVTAVAEGTAEITVETYSNSFYSGPAAQHYTAACAVIVTDAPPAPETYRISYDANGGSGGMAEGTATAGVPFPLPSCGFTAPGNRVFDAWTIGSPGGTRVPAGGTYTFREDTVVYALWGNRAAPSRPSSTGGGRTLYAITVEDSAHGRVSASRARAGGGDRITLTVTPDSGYVLDTLTVTGGDGREIAVTARDSGIYTFTMPERKVSVRAGFTRAPGGAQDCPRDRTCPIWPYTDASTEAWYHDGVHYCLENGLMNGYGGSRFGPGDPISRAQLVQLLHNLEGRPAVNFLLRFTDVPDGKWYAEALRWAASQGIVEGYGDGTFGPDIPITREQKIGRAHV